jgi:crotonobetainyl-CoA:carnitine CoA-transferase CaiB-like acyl-CoA transferase
VDALHDIRVLDLTTGVAGPIVGMFFADFGADVIKVEPPAGDPGRRLPGFAMWNRGKRSVVVNRARFDRVGWLRSAIAAADVVLTNGREQLDGYGLDPAELLEGNHRLVLVEMPTYLADYTPWTADQESAALLAAFGGQAARQSSDSGDPVDSVYPTVLYAHGLWASVCAVAALIERERSGWGQRLVVSGANALAQLTMVALVIDPDDDDTDTAVGGGGRHPTYTRMMAGDGQWFASGALGPKFETALLKALNIEHILADSRIGGELVNLIAPQNVEWVQKAVADALLAKPRAEWLEILDGLGVPCGPVNDRDEFLDHPQLGAIGLRAEVDDPERGRVIMAGVPIGLARTPGVVRGPAPTLGQHDGTVETWSPRKHPTNGGRAPIRPGPLHGFRVLDTGTFVASPYAGSLLASLGAEVIKVEPPSGDPFRVHSYGPNRGMRSLAIDWKSEAGRRVFYRVVEGCDAFIDALRPGLTLHWHIDYESLSKINPEIVTMSLSAYGESGELGGKSGVDMVVQAISGMMSAQGGDGEPVADTIAVCDIITAAMTALTVCLALFNRERTGEGQRTTNTLLATAAYLQCGELVRFPGRAPARRGGRNFKGDRAFDRMYEVADGWIRIDGTAVLDVEHAAAVALDVLESELRTDAAATSAISAKLIGMTAVQAERALNLAGLPTARVRNVSEVIRDPRLLSAEFVHVYPSDVGGFICTPGSFATFSRTPRHGLMLPPGVGEHTREILTAAGLDAAELDQLLTDGVIAQGGPMRHVLLHSYR